MSLCAVWEFRLSEKVDEEYINFYDVIKQLRKIAKKWGFQLEEGEKNGYRHYQGRMSLIKKAVKNSVLKLFKDIPAPNYLEPTVSSEHKKEAFYCFKEQTRIKGPWKDDDPEPAYIPIQYRHITEYYPFQQDIFDNKYYNYRNVNYIYDIDGCIGKSSIACLATTQNNGLYIPPMLDTHKLIEYVHSLLEKMPDGKTPKMFIIDLPKCMDKREMAGLYSAIEQWKTGFIYDTRYKGRQRWIDSPNIWVFSNTPPDKSCLSSDRWMIWVVNKEKRLERYEEYNRDDEGLDYLPIEIRLKKRLVF